MFVRRRTWGYALVLSLTGLGCAHMMETKTIEKFAAHLEKEDLEGLKEHASEEFAGRALRTADAMSDLKILRIPDGKVSVVKVDELSPTHRRVTVEMGESKKEVFYELTKNSEGKWVVDDIYLRQRKQGVEAYKAVSEQMDLLLTVREFINACDEGGREDILNATTPELRNALEKLPPAYLARLTGTITSGRSKGRHEKPQAQLSENTAVVKFPRRTGDTLMMLELAQGHWRVDDVMVDSKDESERLPSLYREALAVEQCLSFLAAYERNDHNAAKELCRDDFYHGCLALGNWKEVRLPSSLLTDHELTAALHGPRADFTLKNDREIVQVTLHRLQDESLDAKPRYQVTNVSIFDVATQQDRRLGALFTARAMGEFYLRALAERDVAKLRHSSTKDFSGRVWKRLNESTVNTVPLEPFDGPPATISQMHFDGALVRMSVLAGTYPVELLLREESGRFLVDDIRWDIPGRPATVKATLELMIPVRNFAAGIALGHEPDQQEAALALLQENSSRDFNRMVWTQTDFIPQTGLSADTFLNTPLKSLTMSDSEVIIQLGSPKYGAEVRMVKEREHFAIDEVLLIAGPLPENRLTMKEDLRLELARGLARRPDGIQTVGATRTAAARPEVDQALFEQPSKESIPSAEPREFEEPEDARPIELWDEFGAVQTEPDPR